MKRVLAFVAAVLLSMTASFAFALNWNVGEAVSPYSVRIIPIERYIDIFGQTRYKQDFQTGETEDGIAFAVRVDVPEKAQNARLDIQGDNVVLNCAASAAVPNVQGVYYLNGDGTLQSELCVLPGYCTGVPTIKASISGTVRVQSAGAYTIIRSDGYLFLNDGRGVAFYTDSNSKVYSAKVILGMSEDKVNAVKLSFALMNDDSEAAWVVRNVLNTLQIELADLLAGKVFINEKILAANFGSLIDCECSKTWGTREALPVSGIPAIPATGIAGDLFVCFGVVCMVLIAFFGKQRK